MSLEEAQQEYQRASKALKAVYDRVKQIQTQGQCRATTESVS